MNNVISSAVVLQIDNDLAAIANRIRERIRRTTSDIIETGRDLLVAKEKLKHGAFLPWIESEFQMTDRTARNYMLAAEWAADKSEIVSTLRPTTLYMLAAPSIPESIKTAVLKDLRAGNAVIDEQVKERISAVRFEKREAARKSRRRRNVSARTQKRHEAEERKRREQAENRKQSVDAAVAEVVTILQKLPPQDFRRLRDLLKDYDTASATLERFRESAS
jgi:hypothetical protein